jgi:hypothetical protein
MIVDKNPEWTTADRHPFFLKEGKEVVLFLAVMAFISEHLHEFNNIPENSRIKIFPFFQVFSQGCHDAHHSLNDVVFLLQDFSRSFSHILVSHEFVVPNPVQTPVPVTIPYLNFAGRTHYNWMQTWR